MPSSYKGILAGFVGSVVLSLLMVLFNNMGVLPEVDIVTQIDKLGSIQRTAAWVDHFIVGTLLWGPIFAGFQATVPETLSNVVKGLIFGLITWVLMMLIFMPVIGAGLFGWRGGIVEPFGMLGMNLIYGLVLGVVFDILDKTFPTKSLLPTEPPLPEMAQFKDPD